MDNATSPRDHTGTQASPDSIIQIAAGFLAAKQLFVASEIGLFEGLADRPSTLDEMAQRLGTPQRTLRIVADAMVSLGVLERHQASYENGAAAATFLSGRTPADLRPFLRLWNRLSYPRWTQLEEVVRGDRPGVEFTEEQQELYSAGVESITAGSAQALAANYDFTRHRRVLDLGGGTGSFLLPLLDRYPTLECTLFEVSRVAAVARRRLADNRLAARIRIAEGDFFKDPIPNGHDSVIVANIFHNLKPDSCLQILRRTRRAVSEGARLLIVDFWTDTTHTKPPFAALMAGEFLMTPGGGDVYSVEEGRTWLHQTGWSMVEHKALAGPASLLVAETTTE